MSRNFYPVITHQTRVTQISSTLKDNIFSNRVDEMQSTGVITTNISDHYPIFSRELRLTLQTMFSQLIIYIEFLLMKICIFLKINFNTQTGNQLWTMMTLILWTIPKYFALYLCAVQLCVPESLLK